MRKVFSFILNFYSMIFLVLTILLCLYFNTVKGEELGKAYLRAYLFLNIGVRGIIAFITNTYPPTARTIAQAYNWEQGTLIQRELAANIGAIGVMGLLCLYFDGLFWLASLIGGTLGCIISETQNLFSIFRENHHPFGKEGDKSYYIISFALFFGMHIDLIISFFSLILGLIILLP